MEIGCRTMENKQPDWIAYHDENNVLVQRHCKVTYKDSAIVTFIVAPLSPSISIPWHCIRKLKESKESNLEGEE